MGLFSWLLGDGHTVPYQQELTQADVDAAKAEEKQTAQQAKWATQYIKAKGQSAINRAMTDAAWKLLPIAYEEAKGIREGSTEAKRIGMKTAREAGKKRISGYAKSLVSRSKQR